MQMMTLKSPPLCCYIVASLASSMDPECRIGKSCLRLGKSRADDGSYHIEGKARQEHAHYSSAWMPAADEASIPPLPLQILHACVACHHGLAGLCACTVSTARSWFVPSLAWTLALVSDPLLVLLPGNWGSTSGYLSNVCKNGPLGSGFQSHADIYIQSHTGVMFFFHVYMLVI